MTNTSKQHTDHPARKEGRTLSGVCDKCEEPIYSIHDHADDCLWSKI